MERARSYRRAPLTPEQLALARERAQHVIVLMLENRSFDHMLGYLDHPGPGWDGLPNGDVPNPFDLEKPDDAVGFQLGAEPVLRFDPPHGHASAMMQMNEKPAGGFAMNGFVAAYAEKIAGREKVTTPKWFRIALLVVLVVVPLVTAALYNLARLGVNGGWLDFWPVAGATLAVIAVLALLVLRLDKLPNVSPGWLAVGLVAVSFVVAHAIQAMLRWLDDPRGVFGWNAIGLVIGILVVLFARRRYHRATPVPAHRLRAASGRVMRCWDPADIPALATLARQFAVCTRWHSSVPGATWPNRNFAHAATSSESVDIEVGFYEEPTIFERLGDAYGRESTPDPWRIYFHDTPQVVAFRKVWEDAPDGAWRGAERLLDDIRNCDLPRYAFVEPQHSGPGSNSQHPGNNMDELSTDFEDGEKLIAAIYNALVEQEDLFKHTVFVVTYDEHGGFPDRCEPPRALHPDAPWSVRRRPELLRRIVSLFVTYGTSPFRFNRLGVRVPALVVSPWVRPHTVDPTIYDHSSIVATLRRLCEPEAPPLTRRDEQANDFLHLLVEQDQPMSPTAVPGFDQAGIEPQLVVDAAATAGPPPDVMAQTGSELEDQLESLNFLLRSTVETPSATERAAPGLMDAGGGAAPQPVGVPTAELLRSFSDSTYNGNPTADDF
jgi:hypothetical protein